MFCINKQAHTSVTYVISEINTDLPQKVQDLNTKERLHKYTKKIFTTTTIRQQSVLISHKKYSMTISSQ